MGKPNAATWKYVYDLPENLHHSLISKFPHHIQRTSGSISSTTKDSTSSSWVTFNNGRQPVFRTRRTTTSLEYIPLYVKYIFAAWQTPVSICLTIHTSGVQTGGGLGVQTPCPPKFRRPSKIVQNSTWLWKLLKIAEFRKPTPQNVHKKGSKILKLPRFAIVLH